MSIEVEGRKFRDPPVLERLLDQLDSNSEFRFLRFVGRARGRGSPRLAAARRPLASKKWKRPLVSHAGGGGDFVHFGPLYE